jgi:hypothetical protein
MLALSIRQPYAEEILRRIKRIEYRSRRTKTIGERFYIYAAMKRAEGADIAGRFARLRKRPGDLPTGVLVGTAMIARCTPGRSGYEWHLTGVKRLARMRRPTQHPQPAWFNPF